MDLMIRTSGETRLSDFMLWQAHHAHLAFVDQLWPDLSFLDFARCVVAYQRQHTRLQEMRLATAQVPVAGTGAAGGWSGQGTSERLGSVLASRAGDVDSCEPHDHDSAGRNSLSVSGVRAAQHTGSKPQHTLGANNAQQSQHVPSSYQYPYALPDQPQAWAPHPLKAVMKSASSTAVSAVRSLASALAWLSGSGSQHQFMWSGNTVAQDATGGPIEQHGAELAVQCSEGSWKEVELRLGAPSRSGSGCGMVVSSPGTCGAGSRCQAAVAAAGGKCAKEDAMSVSPASSPGVARVAGVEAGDSSVSEGSSEGSGLFCAAFEPCQCWAGCSQEGGDLQVMLDERVGVSTSGSGEGLGQGGGVKLMAFKGEDREVGEEQGKSCEAVAGVPAGKVAAVLATKSAGCAAGGRQLERVMSFLGYQQELHQKWLAEHAHL